MNVRKVFGPPGSGKTTFLLNIVEQELDNGIPPNKIGYFAFTRKAATEAKDRAIAKFPHLHSDTDFPWFRTLHSLAFKCLGVGAKDIMKPEHYSEFAKQAGLEIAVDTDEESIVVRTDNPILNEINIARIRGNDLRTHYNQSNMDIEWFHFEYVERAYRHYKEAHNLIDFTDLLEMVVQEPDRLPSLEVLIVDEAQDLSRLQWNLVRELCLRAQRAFLAGDDDQAIYTWAGADVKTFLEFNGDITVLDQSYRVPAKVHALAGTVVNRIRRRQQKTWNPRDYEGEVAFYNDYEHVNVSQGEWLVLATTNYLLNGPHEWLKSQGLLFERHGHRSIPEAVLTAVLGWESLRRGKEIPFPVVKAIYKYLGSEFVARGYKQLKDANPEELYTMEKLKQNHGLLTEVIWHEALNKIGEEKRDYIIALLRRGTKITSKAPIKLSTIHGAKGGEADNVMLLMDLSSKFAKEYERNPDDVNRLLYTGITRTRQKLHIILPKNAQKGFRL
jgi:DNA helicase II / ATP-dependent DNA helicase PcrA